jgi:hypothetical protein
MQTNEMGWFNIFAFLMIFVMREICHEPWLTKYGLRVWMGRSIDWKGMILQDYNEMMKFLCLA